MPNIVDRFNIGGEEYHIEPVIDQTPEQGSQHAIASGAVWPYTDDRGDTAKAASTGIFTRNGAFDYTLGSTTATSWLMKVFGRLMGRLRWQRGTGFNYGRANRALIYANGIYVASGSNIGLWWSEDGKAWTKVTGLPTEDMRDVVYADGLWVCGSSMNGIWWSEDGKSWTQGTGTDASAVYSNTTYGNGLWISYTSNNKGIWWSEDGKAWTLCTGVSSTRTASLVKYVNGLWLAGVASSGVWWSNDGKSWTQCTGISSTLSILYKIEYADGLFEAATTSGMWWSEDGKAWTQGTGDLTSYSMRCVTRITTQTGSFWYAGAGSHGIWSSSNGKSWTQALGDSTNKTFEGFMRVADITLAFSSTAGIWWSTGGTFQQGTGGNETHGFNYCLYTNGLWLACSRTSNLWWSEDGKVWGTVQGPAGAVDNILYNNDMIVVASSGAFYWNDIECLIRSNYFSTSRVGKLQS